MAKETKLQNVVLPSRGPDKTFDVTVTDDIVSSVTPSSAERKCPSLLLPPLCHPHLHLDKAYILTCNNSTYAHLMPKTGAFSEALTTTLEAKSLYTEEDLYLRGSQLLATIYKQGATTARTFVEVDASAGTLPLTVARRLKRDFAHLIQLQIVAFAQEPIYSGPDGKKNRLLLEATLESEAGQDIDVIGTTPYVESSSIYSMSNIQWAVEWAVKLKKHVDFHLDYNIEAWSLSYPDDASRPLLWAVLDTIRDRSWAADNPGKTVVIGHCTQISVYGTDEFKFLLDKVKTATEDFKIPIHFVGLPTSDLFMMGRAHQPKPRGTLPVMDLIRCGLDACLGVNNVGNAFTPFGTADPLQLASWGVGIYQAGTEADAETLYGCVSWRARRAIGLASEQDAKAGGETDVYEGMRWRPMLLVRNAETIELGGKAGGGGREAGQAMLKVPAMQRRCIRDVVWDPPEVNFRSIV